MPPEATVLVPTHDHGPTLLRSVPSALSQTVADLEVIIVGDGVPEPAREVIRELERRDERVRFLDYPKGRNRGEEHRHAALREARGRIVCYLTDDDLWLPDHVAALRELLRDADFAHTLPIRAEPDGSIGGWPGDLALPAFRRLILEGHNFIPFPCGGHTLEAYRRLPEGWAVSERAGHATDLGMWQRFLELPSVRVASGVRPTVVYFHDRAGWTLDARLAEMDRWAATLATEDGRATVRQRVLESYVRDRAHHLAALLDAVGDDPVGPLLFQAHQITADRGPEWDMREASLASAEGVPELMTARRDLGVLSRELEAVSAERNDLRRALNLVVGSRTWRLRELMLRTPGIGALVRWAGRARAARAPR